MTIRSIDRPVGAAGDWLPAAVVGGSLMMAIILWSLAGYGAYKLLTRKTRRG